MYPTTAMALFCQDVREEVGDTLTLVGVMKDNINVTNLTDSDGGDSGTKKKQHSKTLFKVCIYLRINFDPKRKFKKGKLTLVFPDGRIEDPIELDIAKMHEAGVRAQEKGNPLAGILTRMELSGFAVSKPGNLKVEIEIDGEVLLAGALNFLKPITEAKLSGTSTVN